MNRYISSFLITAMLYSSMVAAIFYVNELNPLSKTSKEVSKEQSKVKVALLSPPVKEVKKVETKKKEIKKDPEKKPKEKIVKKIEEPKMIEKKPPKKIVKKEIKKPKAKPKKVVEKIVKKDLPKKQEPEKKKELKAKEIVKKKVETLKEAVQKKPEVKKEIVKEIIKEPLQKVVNSAPKKAAPKVVKRDDKEIEAKKINELKSRYFASLQEKLNENKSYPKRARVRNIEGDIKVEFEISPSGELLSFRIVDGRKLFFRSTKKAIESIFPFKPPMGVISKNTTIKLTLAYRLN